MSRTSIQGTWPSGSWYQPSRSHWQRPICVSHFYCLAVVWSQTRSLNEIFSEYHYYYSNSGVAFEYLLTDYYWQVALPVVCQDFGARYRSFYPACLHWQPTHVVITCIWTVFPLYLSILNVRNMSWSCSDYPQISDYTYYSCLRAQTSTCYTNWAVLQIKKTQH